MQQVGGFQVSVPGLGSFVLATFPRQISVLARNYPNFFGDVLTSINIAAFLCLHFHTHTLDLLGCPRKLVNGS